MPFMKMAIDHMNQHHVGELKLFVEYINGETAIEDITLTSIDSQGMHITYNNGSKNILFPFEKEDNIKDIKNLIIQKSRMVKEALTADHKKGKTFSENNIATEVIEFCNSMGSVVLSTLSSQGEPHISYAPMIFDHNHNHTVYIYISQIAEHYRNLTERHKVELMFLSDESQSPSVFLRKRLRYKAQVTEIERDSSEFNKILDSFVEKYGAHAKVVREFKDFHLLALKPTEGAYVKGFGEAFSIKLNGTQMDIAHMTLGGAGEDHQFPNKTS